MGSRVSTRTVLSSVLYPYLPLPYLPGPQVSPTRDNAYNINTVVILKLLNSNPNVWHQPIATDLATSNYCTLPSC
jgi:hypothetical protein